MKFLEELGLESKIRVKTGDVFAYRIRGIYRFARLMKPIERGPMGWGNLTYFYSPTSTTIEPPPLNKQHLLIPARSCMSHVFKAGCFKQVSSGTIEDNDVLDWHCFQDSDGQGWVDRYMNEYGEPVERDSQPCGHMRTDISPHNLEPDIAIALGLIRDREEWKRLPELPEPLFRASRIGKGPSRVVTIIMPGQGAPTRKDHALKHQAGYLRVLEIAKILRQIPGFKEVAVREQFMWETFDETTAYIPLAVKRKQHDTFYEKVALGMQAAGVKDYWILDNQLGDWLAGSIKPKVNPYQI